ncbi:MAG: hypothetical protein JSS20_11575 [Proteobacteria bacterium]|nr:hypothetical protein [Pseudomonadota bacterium]
MPLRMAAGTDQLKLTQRLKEQCAFVLAMLAASLGGCSLTPQSLKTLASASMVAPEAAANAHEPSPTASIATPSPEIATASPESPAEVYSRIARGALRCWFAPGSALKKTHVFNAKADPASAGGAAEILIQTREAPAPGEGVHGSLRAYRILVTPNSTGSVIEAQNLKFTPEQAAAMTSDVTRWIKGDDTCGAALPEAPAAKPAASPIKA